MWSSNIDAQSFKQAYEEYSDAIYRHCYFRVYVRERALELTQETFLRAWEYIGKGHLIDNLRAFLYRVANNLIIDESRKKKEMSLEMLCTEGFDPAFVEKRDIHDVIDAKEMLTFLGSLSEKHRQVVVMRYIDDMKPEEIATITGESVNAVSVRLHRALQQLRALMVHKT